jgi:pyruvate formate lyase activating enzyme
MNAGRTASGLRWKKKSPEVVARERTLRIGALQKTTLLDYPGKVSAIVFTQGCNFRCPYCHNPALVSPAPGAPPVDQEDALVFLDKRKRLLQGVVITGGEPTLQQGLADFCAALKSMGYAVKLDTNGSSPDVLNNLLRSRLLDYVAMDVKASPRKYPEALGDPGDTVAESMDVLNKSSIEHEFRIPCVAPFIDPDILREILALIQGHAPVFLQQARLERVLDPAFFADKGWALTREEMEELKRQADSRGLCAIR